MFLIHFWWWLQHFLGLDDPAGLPYGWWSGSGSVILPPIFTVLGAYALWRYHHTCHYHGCWRNGKHPHGPYMLCKIHHPKVPNDYIGDKAISNV